MNIVEPCRPRLASRGPASVQSPESAQRPAPDAKTTEVPRLQRLRNALLDAEYRLCTQKAELLTHYLRERTQAARGSAGRHLFPAIEAAHARVYARALAAQKAERPLAPWRATVNERLIEMMGRFDGWDSAQWRVDLAHGFAYVLEHMALRVYPDELIVGNSSSQRIGAPVHPDYSGVLLWSELDELSSRSVNPIQITSAQKAALDNDVFPFWASRSVLAHAPRYSANRALIQRINEGDAYVLTQIAGISHLTPDYPSVLREGFGGILARIQTERDRLEHDEARGIVGRDTHEASSFLESAAVCARAAIAFGHRWHSHLEHEARQTVDLTRRQELLEMSDLFARVPEHPAQTFHEALQSVFITHVMVHQESFQHGVSFGRMDQYLYPYYRADITEGRITPQRAVELIGCFLAKAAELLPLFFERATEYFSGLSSASGITLGGTDAKGDDASNELSHLFLIAYDQLRLRQPNLHVRVHPKSDAEFMARCYATIAKGGGMPALFNDEQVISALEGAGVETADAADYAIVGCAEWGVPYRSFPAAGAVFVNLAYVLRQVLLEGDTAPSDWPSLQAAFRLALRTLLVEATEGNNAIELTHALHRPTPLLSNIVGGCIEARRDVTAGGAQYNASGVQAVGLADVADSLTVIRTLVFEKRQLSLLSLRDALATDFRDRAKLLARIRKKVSKYGAGESTSAEVASWVAATVNEEVGRLVNHRGGAYRAGFWSMTTHQGFGRRTGALPSGRRAGAALSNGASPCTGADCRGPTASMNATARVIAGANGMVTNQKLGPGVLRGRETPILDGLVRGYFAQGGAQVQFNVLDPAVLLDAKRHPERYRDLVVRISGYSAYFNDLTEAMKDELIARTAHEVV